PSDISWAGLADSGALARLDRRATGMDRAALITTLLTQGRIAVLRCDEHLTAWAGIRAFGRGLVVGPVIAPDTDTAQALLCCALADHPGAFIRIDTPVDSGLSSWLDSINLSRVGGGIAMSTAPHQPTTSFRSFALASQALG